MTRHAAALLVLAAALVAAVLGGQLAAGGGSFTPAPAADPCTVRSASSVSTGIDGLTERLVLLGVDRAACRLHVTRESLVLTLASPGPRTDAQVAALHSGLLDAVALLKAAGTLPRASALAGEAISRSSLNGLLKRLLRALPDSLVDASLSTDDVLDRAIADLDVRAALTDLDDPDALNRRVQAAVTTAVRQALLARLRSLV